MSVSAQKLTMKLASDVSKMARNISSNHDAAKLNLYNDISDIYTLSSPMLFHKTLDVLLLFSCTYMVNLPPPVPTRDALLYCIGRQSTTKGVFVERTFVNAL